ncbi:MAG: hypothetical protein IKD79_01885, partial [Oscillospiraceae bacterium]|nr:hypothetical protein [Oscillospiraceae bacterium]
MTERKQLKASARAILRETRPSAIWVTLMVAGILLIMEALSLSINGDLEAYRAMYNSLLEGRLEYVAAAGTNSPIGWLLGMALDLMGMVLAVGYTLYILRLSRRQGPSFGDVFDAFGLFLRAVWITILRRVLVSLWGFAYVIPATVLGTVMDPF